jgi:hypothetical protein
MRETVRQTDSQAEVAQGRVFGSAVEPHRHVNRTSRTGQAHRPSTEPGYGAGAGLLPAPVVLPVRQVGHSLSEINPCPIGRNGHRQASVVPHDPRVEAGNHVETKNAATPVRARGQAGLAWSPRADSWHYAGYRARPGPGTGRRSSRGSAPGKLDGRSGDRCPGSVTGQARHPRHPTLTGLPWIRNGRPGR